MRDFLEEKKVTCPFVVSKIFENSKLIDYVEWRRTSWGVYESKRERRYRRQGGFETDEDGDDYDDENYL